MRAEATSDRRRLVERDRRPTPSGIGWIVGLHCPGRVELANRPSPTSSTSRCPIVLGQAWQGDRPTWPAASGVQKEPAKPPSVRRDRESRAVAEGSRLSERLSGLFSQNVAAKIIRTATRGLENNVSDCAGAPLEPTEN
ncbi:hypothetical protein VTK73DRAFT_9850 [Phialemonium thermophilum]|uniref:Uncharacterized protein n=1 Tax=Phialemonium thermophilum TaxID=223376 RepID=A0ABR3VZW5_9PEZI